MVHDEDAEDLADSTGEVGGLVVVGFGEEVASGAAAAVVSAGLGLLGSLEVATSPGAGPGEAVALSEEVAFSEERVFPV